jgi:DNA-binding transcriptional ArsR family regulator
VGRPAIITRDVQGLSAHELLARVFRTLGDANRLRILELLSAVGERTQSQLVAELGLAQSRASEHLACLVWCGFVQSERQGREVYYRLAGPDALAMIGVARAYMSENACELGSCTTLGQDLDKAPR